MTRMKPFMLTLLLLCVYCNSYADAVSEQTASLGEADLKLTEYGLKDIETDEDGYFVNTSGDGYLTFEGMDVPRSRACFLAFDAEFKEPMFRPGLFEAFWAVDPGAFSRKQKVQFLISHKSTNERHLFALPLCKLYGYSGNLNIPRYQGNIVGIRLDYPANRTIGLKIHKLGLYSKTELDDLSNSRNVVTLEGYERVSGKAFLSADVALSKIYFGIEEGAKRLAQDWLFLAFWLSLILWLSVMIVRGNGARDNQHDRSNTG